MLHRLLLLFLLAIPAWAQVTLVNAGGPVFGDWAASTGFTGGASFTGNTADIDDTTDDTLFVTGIEGTTSFQWSTTITPGYYRVHLLFAETQGNARGNRRFNITLNSAVIASNLDVFDRAGAEATAYHLNTFVATPGTTLTLAFNRVSGDPFVNAIHVELISEISRGDTLPATCTEGQAFTLTSATPGANFHICTDTALGTWTVQSGSSSVSTDDIGTDELDDGANTPTAGDIVIVETGGASFDYLTPSANTTSLLNAADYAAWRTLLGLVIGTNVQAFDADLSTYAGITPSANVQTLLGAADFAAFRASLSLVVGTNVQAFDADLTTWAGITPGANVGTFLATPSIANLFAITPEVGAPNIVTGTSGTDAYAGTSNVQALVNGMRITLIPDVANVGAATLDPGPGAALPIYQNTDGNDPDDDDFLPNVPKVLTYCAACNAAAGAFIYFGKSGVKESVAFADTAVGDAVAVYGPDGKLPIGGMPPELFRNQFCAAIPFDATVGDALPPVFVDAAFLIDKVVSGTTSGTVSFNVEKRSTIAGVGTDVLSAELVADNTDQTSCAPGGGCDVNTITSGSVSANTWLVWTVSGVSTPGAFSACALGAYQ